MQRHRRATGYLPSSNGIQSHSNPGKYFTNPYKIIIFLRNSFFDMRKFACTPKTVYVWYKYFIPFCVGVMSFRVGRNFILLFWKNNEGINVREYFSHFKGL